MINLDEFNYDGRQEGFVEETYSFLGSEDLPDNFHQKYITIWMSRECNSKCKHCYQKGDPRGRGWDYAKADAVTDLFLKDGYIVHPIVNEWLPHYWDFLRIKKKCHSTEITTNGILITSRYKEFFPLLHENNISDIKFTIFPKECHKYITGRKRENVIQAIKLSLKDGFRVTLNYVVMKSTLHTIPSFVEEAIKLGVHEIYFMYYFCIDPKNNMFSQVLSPQDIKCFWKYWQMLNDSEYTQKIKFSKMAAFGLNPYNEDHYRKASRCKRFCLAGRWEYLDFLYMDPEGKIYPCNMVSGEKYQIGEIFDDDGNWNYRFIDNNWQDKLKGFNKSMCAGRMETNRIWHEAQKSIKSDSSTSK